MNTMIIKIMAAIVCALLYLSSITTTAQKLTPLHIGDTVPDVTLKMLGYKTKTVHLSEFKGKLLILDFWSDWCTVCVAQFPRLDSLQKQFGDKLCILPVGFDYQARSIEHFRESRKGTKREMKIATAVQSITDSTMRQLFPFQGLPTEVWINENRIVTAITDHLAVTAETITKAFRGSIVDLPQKVYNSNLDWQKPLLVAGNGGADSDFIFRSIILPYQNSFPSKVISTSNERFLHLAYLNLPVLQMLKDAIREVNKNINIPNDRLNKQLLLKITDTAKLSLLNGVFTNDYIAMEKFKHNSFYTYELMLPRYYNLQDAYALMLTELETYFKVRVDIEAHQLNCLALVRNSKENKLGTIKKAQEINISEDNLEFDCISGSIKELMAYLNTYFQVPYIIDQTGYVGNVNIHISVSSLTDLSVLRNELKKYDLDLIERKENVNIVVIQDSFTTAGK